MAPAEYLGFKYLPQKPSVSRNGKSTRPVNANQDAAARSFGQASLWTPTMTPMAMLNSANHHAYQRML